MEEEKPYHIYLSNSLFFKYGIVISKLVWANTHKEICEEFEISQDYLPKLLKSWNDGEKFTNHRTENGGHNKTIDENIKQSLADILLASRGLSLRNLASEMDLELQSQQFLRFFVKCEKIHFLCFSRKDIFLIPIFLRNQTEKDD